METDLAPEVAAGAIYRIAVLALVFFVALAVRKLSHWPVFVAVLFGMASNTAFLMGSLSAAAVLAVPFLGLVGWVMIDYMRHDTVALRALIGKQQSAWSMERHELMNDMAAREAELFVLRDKTQGKQDARGDDQNARGERQNKRQVRQDKRQRAQDNRDLGSASDE